MTIDATQDITFLDETREEETEEKMASAEHGAIEIALGSYIFQFVHPRKLGIVVGSQTTFKLSGTPSTRQPDVAFIKQERLPQSLRGTAAIAPDLAVEIISETDRIFDTKAKILQYQESKIPLVWVIDPFSQTVEIYRRETGLVPQVIGINGELEGEDVIPGFKLGVSLLFDY